MKLFEKTLAKTTISLTVILFAAAFLNSARQIFMLEEQIIREYVNLGHFAAGHIKENITNPSRVKDLQKLAGWDNFLFWWVVGPDDRIYQASDDSVLQTRAADRFPEVEAAAGENIIVTKGAKQGIVIEAFQVGEEEYTLWLGFSLRERGGGTIRKIILTNTLFSVLTAGLLGAIFYFPNARVAGFLRALIRDLKIIGHGDFRHRIKVPSNDELGELAAACNEMAANLEESNFSTASMNNLLTAMVDGLVVVDPEGKICRVNQALCRLLGYKKEELLGRPPATVFPEAEKIPHSMRGLVNYETAGLKKSGEEVPVLLSCSVMADQRSGKEYIVCSSRDITERKQMLSYQASHDPLTGLVNRLKFEEFLDRAIERVKNRKEGGILFFLDLDKFKYINDSCGHYAGDRMLRQLALIIQAMVRRTGVVARLGGDEFGILLENFPLPAACDLAGKLCRAVQESRLSWQGKSFNIGVSIGIVEITAAGGDSDYLLSAADQACALAKQKGGGAYHLFCKDDPELSKYHGEMQWLPRVTRALEEDLFELHYQPIIPVRGEEKEVRYEILLRLRDEKGGVAPPGMFFPAAEKNSLMPMIDRWVIKTFFSLYHQKYLAGPQGKPPLYNINLSGASLNDSTFLPFVQEQLQRYNIPAKVICFEITETIAVAGFHQAVQFIQETKRLGCRFAIDDFGKGISSFNYLKHFPVDYLKIDGAFVQNMLDSPVDSIIVETINRLGHFLGIKTIAEFVENEAVFNKLKELGVDYVQGYWIAHPQLLQLSFV